MGSVDRTARLVVAIVTCSLLCMLMVQVEGLGEAVLEGWS